MVSKARRKKILDGLTQKESVPEIRLSIRVRNFVALNEPQK
jgi:hypothetical protein